MNTQQSPRRRPRLFVPAAAAIACLFLQFGYDGGLPALADDVWNYRSGKVRVAENERFAEALSEQLAQSNRRTELRIVLLDDLKAGRISLASAADEYAALLAQDPAHFAILRNGNDGYDDAEKLANFFVATLAGDRDVPAEVTARLSDEFREEFGRAPAHPADSRPNPFAPVRADAAAVH